MSDSEVKPATFKRGVPKAASNGIYGMERHLIANPTERIVAVVTYGVEDVIDKTVKGEQYPIVETIHIEPLVEAKAIAAALKLQEAARVARTGDEQLDMPTPAPEAPPADFDTPLTEKDATYEGGEPE